MSGLKRNYAEMLRSGKNLPPESPFKQYSFDRPYPQQFSLPHPMVIYTIKRHKPVNLHVKFMKLCKYAYAKNRIVPVSEIKFVDHIPKPFWTAIWMTNTYGRPKKLDFQNGKFKLWVLGRNVYFANILGYLDSQPTNIASKLSPKIYRFEDESSFQNQIMSFNDFKILTNNTKEVRHWVNNVIKYPDGSIVPFECILENLLHVSSLQYTFSPTENDSSLRTPQNIKNMMDVLSRPDNHIRELRILGFSETFDIALFAPFLLKQKNMDVYIGFHGELSESFKRKLENVIDQVLQAFPPQNSRVIGSPYIYYNGMSREKRYKVWRNFFGYAPPNFYFR